MFKSFDLLNFALLVILLLSCEGALCIFGILASSQTYEL